ncbi:ribosomal-processing cysteine protease Prp [Longirhabdus pacifica]|uniref:ribosomal-processing cysteine protease Prp n=1 Tax=Longirhabdus pacifica TaxID=2305227 RepID=UPI0010091053|nr:ribosomal-processing cysteine protease Prp [Longirhabdus pacifica]
MIHISIFHDSALDRVEGYHVEGHAYYDDPGKDIVCAGVSAVVVGTVNAIEHELSFEPAYKMEDGLLQVNVCLLSDKQQEHNLQVIFRTMISMLQTIEQSYGDFIHINVIKRGGAPE